jgi:hypothetical protein
MTFNIVDGIFRDAITASAIGLSEDVLGYLVRFCSQFADGLSSSLRVAGQYSLMIHAPVWSTPIVNLKSAVHARANLPYFRVTL